MPLNKGEHSIAEGLRISSLTCNVHGNPGTFWFASYILCDEPDCSQRLRDEILTPKPRQDVTDG